MSVKPSICAMVSMAALMAAASPERPISTRPSPSPLNWTTPMCAPAALTGKEGTRSLEKLFMVAKSLAKMLPEPSSTSMRSSAVAQAEVGVAVAPLPGVEVGLKVGVLVGVTTLVGVGVGVLVGVCVGIGVFVAGLVGVTVGVLLGVGVGQALVTSWLSTAPRLSKSETEKTWLAS